uniref:Nucleosome assembly protein 1-like 4 n=1 Tax=Anopheles farauti TaxID=69004 RepID=A0A182QUQ7_9DIPT
MSEQTYETSLEADEASLLQQISAIEKRIEEIDIAQKSSIVSFPPNIQAKLFALRKIQLDIIDREVQFHLKAHAMEVDYQTEFKQCHQLIARIVNGEAVSELVEVDAATNDVADQPNGVPDFWLTVLKASFLDGIVQEQDEPVLRQLRDIRCILINEPEPGFELQFEFASNDYFTNDLLTKQYFLRCAADMEEPAKFNGFEIYRCIGCDIDWKLDHNLTKDPEMNSFFSFFMPENIAEVDTNYSVMMMECDFQYGYYIKETLIPRAVFLFLGENPDLGDKGTMCSCDRCLYIECLDHMTACPGLNTDDEKEEAEEEREAEDDGKESHVPSGSSM